jgi:hypothetical protein
MAGTLKVTAFVKVSGPLFDGAAENAAGDLTAAATKAIAGEGVDRLRRFPMNKSGRSTGAFAAHVRAEPYGTGQVIRAPMVKGVTWGPWLQGGTKRNASTGFRGYRLFSKTAASLDLDATSIAERVLQEYLPKMGGQ